MPSQSSAASPQPAMLQPSERDDRQQEREHDRSAGRGQQVIRLGAPGREEGAEHQLMFP